MLAILIDISKIDPEQFHKPEVHQSGYLKADCVARGWPGEERDSMRSSACLLVRAPIWRKGTHTDNY